MPANGRRRDRSSAELFPRLQVGAAIDQDCPCYGGQTRIQRTSRQVRMRGHHMCPTPLRASANEEWEIVFPADGAEGPIPLLPERTAGRPPKPSEGVRRPLLRPLTARRWTLPLSQRARLSRRPYAGNGAPDSFAGSAS